MGTSVAENCLPIQPTFEAENWDFQDALNQGDFINLSNRNEPIKYIMYSNAQITDVYNCYRRDGNLLEFGYDTFEGNKTFNLIDPETGDSYSEIVPFINNIPYQFTNYSDELLHQGNNSFVYLIRSTASFLYFAAKEFGIFSNIIVKNNFTGGKLYVDGDEKNETELPFDLQTIVGNTHTFTAVEPQYVNNSHQIWNDTESPNSPKSSWQKFEADSNNPILKTQNISYNFTVETIDANATYVADMKEAHKVDKNYDTEFHGVVSQEPKYLVKYSSGNVIADQYIYPNGYPLVFGGWGDQIVPNNSRSRPINNINQDLEVNAN
ncbi:MAG: hypothetical protein K8F36_14280, partial [Melioribacteraceae bacterium]|nr:hypothetical protein [Melioribacteraceae bacterium]